MFASTGAVQTGAGHQLVLLVIAEPFVRGGRWLPDWNDRAIRGVTATANVDTLEIVPFR